MIKQIKENIWQICFENFGSCVYLIELENKKILIDTGSPDTLEELKDSLKELKTSPQEIDLIILTHFHYDHVAGTILFPNSEVYASPKDFGENVKDIHTLPINEFKIIETPGHSKGSICILYKDVLFSGDTLFHNGVGRTDLPGGSETELMQSLEKLSNIDYKILAPGHV